MKGLISYLDKEDKSGGTKWGVGRRHNKAGLIVLSYVVLYVCLPHNVMSPLLMNDESVFCVPSLLAKTFNYFSE